MIANALYFTPEPEGLKTGTLPWCIATIHATTLIISALTMLKIALGMTWLMADNPYDAEGSASHAADELIAECEKGQAEARKIGADNGWELPEIPPAAHST